MAPVVVIPSALSITDLAILFEHATAALNACVDRGMQLPFILCVVAPNGSVAAIRTDGVEPELSSMSNPRGSGCRSQSWSWITPARRGSFILNPLSGLFPQ